MNERIRELKQQATDYVDSIDNGIGIEEYRKLLDQKFAELIVGECMEQVWYSREDGINGNVSQVIKDRMKQHFGVEE